MRTELTKIYKQALSSDQELANSANVFHCVSELILCKTESDQPINLCRTSGLFVAGACRLVGLPASL